MRAGQVALRVCSSCAIQLSPPAGQVESARQQESQLAELRRDLKGFRVEPLHQVQLAPRFPPITAPKSRTCRARRQAWQPARRSARKRPRSADAGFGAQSLAPNRLAAAKRPRPPAHPAHRESSRSASLGEGSRNCGCACVCDEETGDEEGCRQGEEASPQNEEDCRQDDEDRRQEGQAVACACARLAALSLLRRSLSRRAQ
jgi:hypothetical protein